MAVQWPKFLAPVTVPTGGWAFQWNEATVTVPAGDYPTPLHVAAALEAAIDVSYVGTVAISSVGITTINITTMSSVTWAGTNDSLSALLGFTESETVASNTLTSTNRHTHGWYPGIISFGAASGAGPSADSDWIPNDQPIRSYAGNGSARIVAPSRRMYRRRLRFGPLTRTEVFQSRGRGPCELLDRWSDKVIWWYLSRTDGAAGSYGTQIDPGDGNYDVDADGDYYKVTVASEPTIDNAGAADWMNVTFQLAPEPA